MIAVKWTGRVASSNKRHTKSRTTGRLINTNVYRDFRDNLAWTIKAQYPAIRYEKISVIISVTVSNRLDHHNLHKPILDAIQESGMIGNDRNIMFITWLPAERHKQGEPDEIILMISEMKGGDVVMK